LKRLNQLILFTCLLTSLSSSATTGYEGVNLTLSFFLGGEEETNNKTGEKAEENTLILSSRLGTTMEGGFYLGLLYESERIDNGSYELAAINKGATIGITHKGSYILYHFILDASQDIDAATTHSGKGSGMDFGYHFEMGAGFSAGAQLSFRSLEFDTSKGRWKIVNRY
jgi:hypothetical protein